MSKIGKKIITIPAGVTVAIVDSKVTVKGPKGELSYTMLPGVSATQEGSELSIAVDHESKKNFWGLTRSLVQNMVTGVSEGYTIKMQILGVGFTVKLAGQKLIFALGFSHPVEFALPKGIEASVEKDPKGNDILTLTGIDKQVIGEAAAKIRKMKSPEPYKGKGIRFLGETVKLKAGKAAKK